jgi:hypothetical protein
MRLKTFALLFGLLVVVVGIFSIAAYNSMPRYPYGWSHCCSKGLNMALLNYADRHAGRLPTGEQTPEASLSLLYREGLADANLLRGKTMPLETVQAILERGELLGPDSTGWHYVEGLTMRDDHRIAVVWDKVGLGHNGQELKGGGHTVLFVGGDERFVPMEEWPAFLEEQQKLLAARSPEAVAAEPCLKAQVRLANGELVEAYDAPFTISCNYKTVSGEFAGSRTSSGSALTPGNLRW